MNHGMLHQSPASRISGALGNDTLRYKYPHGVSYRNTHFTAIATSLYQVFLPNGMPYQGIARVTSRNIHVTHMIDRSKQSACIRLRQQVAASSLFWSHAWRHLLSSPIAHFKTTLLTR